MKNSISRFSFILLCGLVIFSILQVNAKTRRKAKHKKIKAKKEQAIKWTPNRLVTSFNTSGDTAIWIDEQLAAMNDTERIAQLIMMPVYTNKDSVLSRQIINWVKQYNLGGVIMMQGSPYRHVMLINRMNQNAKTPLFVSVDGEWGLAMRLDSVHAFPREMTLGAIPPDTNNEGLLQEYAIEQMGAAVAMQCRRVGINIDFAPVVDVNNNKMNPVIYDRSFGDDWKLVSRKGIAYMKGLQSNNVMACAKHFPGHGDTETDSHYGLPKLNFTKSRLDSLELRPFKEMFNAGVQSVMVAHLAVPVLDSSNTPASLSANVVTDLLKKELRFNGLSFTDALNMKGAAQGLNGAQVALKSLLAGNDILLFVSDVPASIDTILNARNRGLITQAEIDNRVRKVLYYKYKLGLNHWQPIDPRNVTQDLNQYDNLIQNLYDHAATSFQSHNLQHWNFQTTDTLFWYVAGMDTMSTFFQLAAKETNRPIRYFCYKNQMPDSVFNYLLPRKNQLIIDAHLINRFAAKNFGFSNAFIKQLSDLQSSQNQIHLFVFGSPYFVGPFADLKNLTVLYQDNIFTANTAFKLWQSALEVTGHLPVTANNRFVAGAGMHILPVVTEDPNGTSIVRTPNYVSPEISKEYLIAIDSVIARSIAEKAFPGCQMVVYKDDKLIYRKSFGTATFESTQKVQNDYLYDLASITKVAATTLCAMKLYEEGRLDLNARISEYLPQAKHTNKKKIQVHDLLLHQAGLPPFVPFHLKWTNQDGTWNPDMLSNTASKKFPNKVADNCFSAYDVPDSIWQVIYNCPLKTKGKYVYSDFDMYFMRAICAAILDTISPEEYVRRNFYQPLHLNSITYNPLQKGIAKQQIMPTELDQRFRHQLVQGYVHDQGAALCGGVQGHAGLFANASDIAKLFAMLEQNGQWEGVQYLKPSTVRYFTSKQSKVSRRGLGFDKQSPQRITDSPTCPSASIATFGHTGFTGTSVWADPVSGLTFVFLSNRVCPNANNKKIIELGVRTTLQEMFYQALDEEKH